jgi:hypothetical protein
MLKNIIILFVLQFVILSSASTLFSASEPGGEIPYRLLISTESKLWLEGDSTSHKYEVGVPVIRLDTAGKLPVSTNMLKGQALLNAIVQMPELSTFILNMPVKEMNSSIPGLAMRMHSVLKYKAFPNIIFTLSDYSAEQKLGKLNAFTVKATGKLNVAGQKKETLLELEIETTDKFIKVTGKEALLMTDFGIKPPKVLFLKAADKVEIKWEIYLILDESR